MSILFDSFKEWKTYCEESRKEIYEPVLRYEIEQKGKSEEEIWDGLSKAYQVMKDAVQTGLTKDMHSYSGMIQGGAKKVADYKTAVVSRPNFSDWWPERWQPRRSIRVWAR